MVNVGSVLGFLPAPYAALCAASKHAVEGYSESLDHETRDFGVRVTVVEPGYTSTSFEANATDVDSPRQLRAGSGARQEGSPAISSGWGRPRCGGPGRVEGGDESHAQAALPGRPDGTPVSAAEKVGADGIAGQRNSQSEQVECKS
jgi:NAD(P)-dependent dehydrogenase (short-subunit alcohol dehydrogenase family)